MTKLLAALLSAFFVLSHAHAAGGPFALLRPGDSPTVDCGTFIHDRGIEATPESMRFFMSTERVLYLRTPAGLRTLELDHIAQKLRVRDVVGRGDTISLFFKAVGKERASLVGTVSQSVVDDDGGYPLIELDAHLSYTDPTGAALPQQRVAAVDRCF